MHHAHPLRRFLVPLTMLALSGLLGSCAKQGPSPEQQIAVRAIADAEKAARAAEAYEPNRQQRITYEFGIREAKDALADGDYVNARILAEDAQRAALRVHGEQDRARQRVVDRMERVHELAMEVHEKPDWGLDLDALFAAVQDEVEKGQIAYDAGDYETALTAANQAIDYLMRRRALFQKDIEVLPLPSSSGSSPSPEAAGAGNPASSPPAAAAPAAKPAKGGSSETSPSGEEAEKAGDGFLRRLRDSLRGDGS